MGLKTKIRELFEELEKMSVQEYTLYKKWEEVNYKEWSLEERQRIFEIKNSIWVPNDSNDYLKLQPDIIHVNDKNTSLTWTLLRTFISTMPWKQSVGRIMRFIIYDRLTRQYLGVLSLASDFISLIPRDQFVGWDFSQRTKKKMLNYTAMGSSIVPTQPLGYNYVGGKLATLMLCSKKVVNTWAMKYKEPLVAITTTSLYGGFSQYNNLKYWTKCGTTEGKIPLEPTDKVYFMIREWVKEKYPTDFRKLTVNEDKILSRPKQRMLAFAYSKLGVKPPENNAPRGVYFCRLYENTNEFLSMKVRDPGRPLFDNELNKMTNLWKEKYAKKRVENLIKTDRFKTDTLFYDDLIGLSWKKAKEKYLPEVGR